MAKKSFSKSKPFINRKKETKFLKNFFTAQSDNILFVYGPKSTGKTTLLNRVISGLDQTKYATSRISMRGVLITNFKDFKKVFFPKDLKGKLKSIVSGIKMNIGFFGWSVDDEALLEDNVFSLMEKKLIEANEKGIKPIIVIDEFQYLRDIVINKEDNLLLVEELWKFFIEITKVKHLCHVVCATSDSYYMEELYTHTKLKNTSNFYLIDHLPKEDVTYRLGKKEKMPTEAVEYFREHLGGSVWEIRQAFVDYKNGYSYQEKIQYMIQIEYGRIADLVLFRFTEQEQASFDIVNKEIIKHGIFDLMKQKQRIPFELIKKLVDLDVWFYNPIIQTLSANSQSIKKAFEKLYDT